MSMCCALLYLIAKMNENEATADYQKDTVMDTDMLVCDVDGAAGSTSSPQSQSAVQCLREANEIIKLYVIR